MADSAFSVERDGQNMCFDFHLHSRYNRGQGDVRSAGVLCVFRGEGLRTLLRLPRRRNVPLVGCLSIGSVNFLPIRYILVGKIALFLRRGTVIIFGSPSKKRPIHIP